METYHEGRPIIRDHGRHGISVLCPYGHSYTWIASRDWAGSMLEANLSDPSFTVKCSGTLPTKEG